MSKIEELVFRAWSYFRTGYGTYLAFPIGFIGFVSTTYYLMINNIPFLTSVFPSFSIYIIVMLLIVPPLGVLIGWFHMKKSLAYSSQEDVSIESNPYTYKIKPGIMTEVSWPTSLLVLKMWEALLEKEGALSPEIKQEITSIREKIEKLTEGELIGVRPELRLSR